MADDLSLIQAIKASNDEDSLKELIAKHSGAYIQAVNKSMSDRLVTNKNDFLEDKNLFIYQRALKYDPERKMKFSTFLYNEVKWKCLNINEKFKNREFVDIDDQAEFLIQKDEGEEEFDASLVDFVYEMADKSIDKRVRTIVRNRYKGSKPTPWKEVARELGLSAQGCINIFNRFKEQVKEELKSKPV